MKPGSPERFDFLQFLTNANLEQFLSRLNVDTTLDHEAVATFWALGKAYPGEAATLNLRCVATLYLGLKAITREREECARLVQEKDEVLAQQIRNRPDPLEEIPSKFR